jgi:UDP-N-acetylglucosamine 2-epimerase
VSCITLADGGSGPATFEKPANLLVGADSKHILDAFYNAADGRSPCFVPRGADGRAAQRIIEILLDDFAPGLSAT